MKIALIQLNIAWESKKVNLNRAKSFIERAAEERCDVIVFPEMFNTGFSMDISKIAEDKNGETFKILSKAAKKNSIYVIAGFPIKLSNEEKGRNIAVVFDRKGNVIAQYTKMHPFSLLKEDQYYLAGNNPVIFNIDKTPCSIFICYDLRFPEIFRKVAKNVEVIFVIANWPSSRKNHWDALLKARAIENQCFVIGVNRTGTDGNGIKYHGSSLVYDPFGRKICSGNSKNEFLICELNPLETLLIRTNFPFLRDMRY